jgi:hypothetical protein
MAGRASASSRRFPSGAGAGKLEWKRANSKLQKEKDFQEWIKRPEIREEFLPESKGGITEETLRKIERELRLL